jgi:NAD/NADP transhydrogenase alpha subunit
LNVVGGFVVTDRMLEMFKVRKPPKVSTEAAGAAAPSTEGDPK